MDITKDDTFTDITEMDFITFLSAEQKEERNTEIVNGWLQHKQYEPIIEERMKVQHYTLHLTLNRDEPILIFSGMCDCYDKDAIFSQVKHFVTLNPNAYFKIRKPMSWETTRKLNFHCPDRHGRVDYINIKTNIIK